MPNIGLNADNEQEKLQELIEYYEDMKAIEKSNIESKGKPTYTLKEVCEMSGVDYEKL